MSERERESVYVSVRVHAFVQERKGELFSSKLWYFVVSI